MSDRSQNRVTLRSWWSICWNVLAMSVLAPVVVGAYLDAVGPLAGRWAKGLLASSPLWWVLVRSPRLGLTLDFSAGRGHYRGLTHDVWFDLADVTLLETVIPWWPPGQGWATENGCRVRFRSRRSLLLTGLSGYDGDFGVRIKLAMHQAGYRNVELSPEEPRLFSGLIPRRPDGDPSDGETADEP